MRISSSEAAPFLSANASQASEIGTIEACAKRYDERDLRHAVGVRPRRIVEAEPFDLAHARDEKAGIEPAHHVALRLVGAGAKIVAVEDAGIGMDAAAAIALEAGRTAQRWRMMRRVVPQPLRLPELTGGFVGGPAVHLTAISAVPSNNPTR